jgi:hypothetical protein
VWQSLVPRHFCGQAQIPAEAPLADFKLQYAHYILFVIHSRSLGSLAIREAHERGEEKINLSRPTFGGRA